MKLVEPRKHILLSKELARAVPELQHLSDQWEADGYLIGVWQDGPFYVFGQSHSDDAPEEVTLVLTAREWRERQKGRVGDKVFAGGVKRARQMYPVLSALHEL